jgi:23S rRNA (cytidine1920-2'-O)/16S rRNA (cytidine1409-2'-O)-methyltransferase
VKSRLDAELVRRSLTRSREAASELITSGKVYVNGIAVSKPASIVDSQSSIKLIDEHDEFVSRGGHKLAGALDHFNNLDITQRVALDAGASTGGFTDVLLKRGVKHVIAVDVGYGQLAWELHSDARVTVLDRVNVRHLTAQQVGQKVDLVVADLSFISLKLVLPALFSVANANADFLIMVKPQFEVGKERLGAGGVVRDPQLRKDAVISVAQSAFEQGFGCLGVVASSLPGPAGNVEYFLWLRKGAPALLEVDLDLAIEMGPV